jgi:RHS repeat-associated protein
VGNRTSRVVGGTTDTYATFGTSNRINTITTGSNVRSFTYLPTGQVSGDTRDPSDAYVYTYNQTGRLTSAALNGSTVGTYLVNGLEQRVAKTVGSTTTHYIFDRFGHLLSEADGSTGAIQKEYIWLDDLLVAEIDDTGSSPVMYYVSTDHLGRPQKMTDATATVVWDGVFDPFGNVTSVSGSTTNLLMFPGQYYDSETQLSQNWDRDYDPTIGKYVESDPIGLRGGINTYAYVNSRPLTLVDLKGLYCTYSQSGGALDCYDDLTGSHYLHCKGYSGNGSGLNNPAAQDQENVGPIPQGNYTIGNPTNEKGPWTFPLIPDSSNVMYGRGGFLIHGDNSSHDNSASEGCIVIPDHDCRKQIPPGESLAVGP